MTTVSQSPRAWCQYEDELLLQCAKDWKKSVKIDWKHHKKILRDLLPIRNIDECKNRYYFLQKQSSRILKAISSSVSTSSCVAKPLLNRNITLYPLKTCLKTQLENNETSPYHQTIALNCQSLFFAEIPIFMKAVITPDSPFAHPPLFEEEFYKSGWNPLHTFQQVNKDYSTLNLDGVLDSGYK